MIILSKVTTAIIKAGRRLVTAIVAGKYDVRQSYEIGPYGWDSSPIQNIRAVYVDTIGNERTIIGYSNNNQVAQPGESRMYSTDTSGTVKYAIYVKADKILIGTGTPVNHFTQWEALNTAIQAQKTLINIELGKIATGVNAIVPGSYTVTPITVDISAAKTTNILTN